MKFLRKEDWRFRCGRNDGEHNADVLLNYLSAGALALTGIFIGAMQFAPQETERLTDNITNRVAAAMESQDNTSTHSETDLSGIEFVPIINKTTLYAQAADKDIIQAAEDATKKVPFILSDGKKTNLAALEDRMLRDLNIEFYDNKMSNADILNFLTHFRALTYKESKLDQFARNPRSTASGIYQQIERFAPEELRPYPSKKKMTSMTAKQKAAFPVFNETGYVLGARNYLALVEKYNNHNIRCADGTSYALDPTFAHQFAAVEHHLGPNAIHRAGCAWQPQLSQAKNQWDAFLDLVKTNPASKLGISERIKNDFLNGMGLYLRVISPQGYADELNSHLAMKATLNRTTDRAGSHTNPG